MVASTETAKDVYQMGQFIHSQGFDNLSVGMQSCSGSAKDGFQVPTIKELILVCEQLSLLVSKLAIRVGFVGSVPVCAIPDDISDKVGFYNICDAAISQMVIGPNGECRPCVEAASVGGNILSESISQIWNSSVFDNIRMFKNIPSECFPCRCLSTCHGGCRASAYNYTGSVIGRNPLMASEIPNEFLLSDS
jgi:radical SAM protein with 4Fe4S-binding SPASM domain